MKLKSLTIAAAMAMALVGGAHAQQVVKVGSTPTGSPFTFLDTKTNTIQGVMVDIAQAVGKDAGFGVQIEPMQFSTLIASLTTKRIDMISAAMFMTDERKKIVDFSEPIYSYGEGLVVPKTDDKPYKSFADMKGMTVGVQVGTAFVKPVQDSGVFKEVKLYDTGPDMMNDLNVGRIQGAFLDFPIAVYMIQQGNYPNLKVDRAYKPVVINSVALVLRKDEKDLMAKVDVSLGKLKANGTLAAIFKKWGLN